jgi:hypothetical protein
VRKISFQLNFLFVTIATVKIETKETLKEWFMAFTYTNGRGDIYYLNGQHVHLKNGREQQIYFFTREPRPGQMSDSLPHGYEINEAKGSGLPILRRIKTDSKY